MVTAIVTEVHYFVKKCNLKKGIIRKYTEHTKFGILILLRLKIFIYPISTYVDFHISFR